MVWDLTLSLGMGPNTAPEVTSLYSEDLLLTTNLCPIGKEGTDPLLGSTSYAIVFEFMDETVVRDNIEGFGKVKYDHIYLLYFVQCSKYVL